MVVVRSAVDARAALAVEPHDRPVDAGRQVAALAVVQEEGVKIRQEGHGLRW
jgi:hypothetical protein